MFIAMARSAELGTVHEVTLPTARIRYRERGEGPPVVFVHGLGVNADLWRHVVPVLAEAGYRCVAPDWPFGAHEVPVPEADLSPPGAADLVADFLAALDLHDATVVGNDSGGAVTQLLMVRRPERVGRVVLTPSDCFDRFPPPPFSVLPALARVPGAIWLLVQAFRIRATHRLPTAFGWVAKRPIPPGIVESYLAPARRDPAVRDDMRRFVRGAHPRHTLAAARDLPRFDRPVLLAWASEDKLFPVALARRLAATLPNATLATIDDSYTFVAEDQPARLAALILDFARTHAPT
jgi:pimeloyl-ACP methyl ester carboxylesterase